MLAEAILHTTPYRILVARSIIHELSALVQEVEFRIGNGRCAWFYKEGSPRGKGAGFGATDMLEGLGRVDNTSRLNGAHKSNSGREEDHAPTYDGNVSGPCFINVCDYDWGRSSRKLE